MDITKGARKQVRILYCICFFFLALGTYSIHNTNNQAYLACKRVQTLQTYATQTIERSEKTLPTLAYYKNPDHKQELLTQLKLSEQAKTAFKPIACHRNII